ncbi:MAG: zinc ABC transporter substrate-binding protein [Peptostreptococcaceae bacterium]|nr:zinc ABC transporter substrate-binding protein [Peptostreptococcaceae bacterium]
MKKILGVFLLTLVLVSFVGCNNNKEAKAENSKLKIVATTTMLRDLVLEIGKDKVDVEGLMGYGIDPHLYKASAGDVDKMSKADIIIYNGLHLEGKMAEIFESMENLNKKVLAVGDIIPKEELIKVESDTKSYDPHIWFDVSLWIKASKYVEEILVESDYDNKDFYEENAKLYIEELEKLDEYIVNQIKELDKNKRVLITAHDAFSYFGKKYNFEVRGLQGLSTVSEAGTLDVKNLADYISDNKIPAIFVESSVSPKNIEALKDAVSSRNYNVEIGGELYSDSLGDEKSGHETYIKTFKHNVDTIVNALNKD